MALISLLLLVACKNLLSFCGALRPCPFSPPFLWFLFLRELFYFWPNISLRNGARPLQINADAKGKTEIKFSNTKNKTRNEM